MTKDNIKNTLEVLNPKKAHVISNANELATAFGNLNKLENDLLDYCVSLIKPSSNGDDDFKIKITEVEKALGRTRSGNDYKLMIKAFDALRTQTNVYVKTDDGILATAVFDNTMEFKETGYVTFRFARGITPFLFNLKNNFYWYEFRRLANIKSKYARMLWRLFERNRHGENQTATIKGNKKQWQDWFLGVDRKKDWTTGRFKQKVLDVAIAELKEKLNVSADLVIEKNGRTTVGYTITITDKEPHSFKKPISTTKKPKKIIQRETLPDWAKDTEQSKTTDPNNENYSNDEINAKLKELRNRKRKN